MTCRVVFGGEDGAASTPTDFNMTDPGHPLWLYFLLVAGIIALPGMDMAFVLSSTLASGRRAGAAAVGGIVAGGLIHSAMGALGVGLVLLSAPRLFNALLLAGALYVGWLGLGLLRGASALLSVGDAPVRGSAATFARAVATCLLNPKAYVFMLAVFPQFLRTDQGPVALQAASLAAITAATQAGIYGVVAAAAARLRQGLTRTATAQVRLGRAVGGMLVLVACWTAWQGWQVAV
jgi:threonine/homoserine/homoserine lactone efflux protein